MEALATKVTDHRQEAEKQNNITELQLCDKFQELMDRFVRVDEECEVLLLLKYVRSKTTYHGRKQGGKKQGQMKTQIAMTNRVLLRRKTTGKEEAAMREGEAPNGQQERKEEDFEVA